MCCRNYDDALSRFDAIAERDIQADRQMDGHGRCINIVVSIALLTRQKMAVLGKPVCR